MRKVKRLAEYHKRALEMKYEGASYREIAEKLNEHYSKKTNKAFSEQTIKDWFKESGTLCVEYRAYEKEADEIHRENTDMIKKMGVRIREQNFRIANEMLVALMGSQTDNVKLAAVKELLDRVEGKPTDNVESEKKHRSYEDIIRQLELEGREYEENEKNSAVGKSA